MTSNTSSSAFRIDLQSPPEAGTDDRGRRDLGAFDLVVVGAGILGLAHAAHGVRRGLRVAVVERDEIPVGASVRNFGHVCTTAQSGLAREYADVSRDDWLTFRDSAGIDVREAGTVIVARTDAEEAALVELSDARPSEARLLTARAVAEVLGRSSEGIRAGALMPLDLRADPLTSLDRLREHLAEAGVHFFFGSNVGAISERRVVTSRGMLRAEHIAVTVGHDLDRFFPGIADRFTIERCRLRMLEIRPPRNIVLAPAVFTGLSLLRYDAFRALDAIDDVRAQFAERSPELIEHDLNHMLTQRPDGAIIVGDTHHRDRTELPFELERSDELILAETAGLFGVDVSELRVRRRWRGVYASSAQTNFVCEEPMSGVRVASVTSGIGMTTAFGFARDSLDALLAGADSLSGSDPHTASDTQTGPGSLGRTSSVAVPGARELSALG